MTYTQRCSTQETRGFERVKKDVEREMTREVYIIFTFLCYRALLCTSSTVYSSLKTHEQSP
jgi:hypothetical protein